MDLVLTHANPKGDAEMHIRCFHKVGCWGVRLFDRSIDRCIDGVGMFSMVGGVGWYRVGAGRPNGPFRSAKSIALSSPLMD